MDGQNDADQNNAVARDGSDSSRTALTDDQRASAAIEAEKLVAATLESGSDPTRRR